ncbi:MAG TPA: phosphatase PAP2 family protein [Nitrospirota bacterium]|nr:phosphatase PAP2 family protein [Nitrospirota bacterium]
MTLQVLDTEILLFINHGLANGFFDVLMPALTLHGYLLIIPYLLAIFLRGAKQENDQGKTFLAAAVWTFLIACAAAYLAGWVEDWIKDIIARPRPCRVVEGVRLLLPCPGSFSMPSGHAISSFAFALPLWHLTRRYIEPLWRFYPLFLAGMIAFSRIYLGAHYPTDVLVGALLGGAIGLALSLLYEVMGTEEGIRRHRK